MRPISSNPRTEPPAASSSRTNGTRHSIARWFAANSRPSPSSLALPEPPRTVKSPALTMILRPPTLQNPSIEPFGVKPASSPPSS